MKQLNHVMLLALAGTLIASSALGADNPGTEGVLVSMHELTVADTDMDPGATTTDEFFHHYQRGAPGRLPMVPTKEVYDLTVRKADGARVKIVQDKDDSLDLEIGDQVQVAQVDGKDRVVKTK